MEIFKAYKSLIRLLSNVLDCYTTAFFITDPKSRQLKLTASQTLSRYLIENASLPLEQSGILSQVQKIGQTIHLDKTTVQEISTALPFYRAGESLIKGVFIISVGDGAGVLYVDTKQTWGFNDKQQKCIRECADLLHELMGEQENLGRQRSYARILDLWRDLDQAAFKGPALDDYARMVVHECSGFLEADYAFMAVNNPGEASCRLIAHTSNVPRSICNQKFSTSRGLVGWVFHNERPISIARLNPDAPDHFLLFPGESLPHNGSFWAMPAQLSPGHSLVLAFLTRSPIQWDSDDQFAITRIFHFFQLVFEQLYWRDRYEQVRALDFATKLYNAPAFEEWVETTLASSMRGNIPFTLVLVQFEPWQILYSKLPPREVRQRQKTLAAELVEIIPPQVVAAQIAENRFGLLFQETTPREVEHYVSLLTDMNQYASIRTLRKTRVKIDAGWASFPGDGTRSEELWPLAYRRLFESSHNLTGTERKYIDREGHCG